MENEYIYKRRAIHFQNSRGGSFLHIRFNIMQPTSDQWRVTLGQNKANGSHIPLHIRMAIYPCICRPLHFHDYALPILEVINWTAVHDSLHTYDLIIWLAIISLLYTALFDRQANRCIKTK